jgi:hypothetical protein
MRAITIEKETNPLSGFVLKERREVLADITDIISDGATEYYNNKTTPIAISALSKINTARSVLVGVVEAIDEFDQGKIEHGTFKLTFPVVSFSIGVLVGGLVAGAGLPVVIIASVATVLALNAADNSVSKGIERRFLSYTKPSQRYKMPKRTLRPYTNVYYNRIMPPDLMELWEN